METICIALNRPLGFGGRTLLGRFTEPPNPKIVLQKHIFVPRTAVHVSYKVCCILLNKIPEKGPNNKSMIINL